MKVFRLKDFQFRESNKDQGGDDISPVIVEVYKPLKFEQAEQHQHEENRVKARFSQVN